MIAEIPAHNKAVLVIIGCYLLIGTWYSLAIPVGEAVDEVPHFFYVCYVKEHWSLPVQPWRENGRPLIVSMGHHPPLYYVLGAVLIAPIDTSDASSAFIANPHFVWQPNYGGNGWNVFLHPPEQRFPYKGAVMALQFLRWWGLALGAVTLFAFSRLSLLIVSQLPWVAVLATGLLAFNPSFIFMSMGVHHDILTACLFSLGLLWLARTVSRWELPRGPRAVAGGILLGLALLTKASALSLVPLYVLVLAWLGWRKRSLSRLIQQTGAVFVPAALVAGWWFGRNQLLYGDPLGWRMFLTVHSHMVRQGRYTWEVFSREFLPQLQSTFWGGFGYMHITLPDPFWQLLTRAFWACCIAALTGLACTGYVLLPKRRGLPLLGLMLLAVVLLFLSFVRFSMATAGAGHGRYLFPVGGPLMLFMAIGLNALAGFRLARSVAALGTAAMAAYAVLAPMVYVMPLYRGPTVLPASEPAGDQVVARFGDCLKLLKVEVPAMGTLPGEEMRVRLYWGLDCEGLPDIAICLQLADRYGNQIARECSWPIPGFSTVAWQTDSVYVGTHAIAVPQDASLGVGTLSVSAKVGREGSSLTPSTGGGDHEVEWVAIAHPLVGRITTLASLKLPPERSCHFTFGRDIRLVGFSLPARTVTPGRAIPLTLYWEAQSVPDENYVVFVHIVDGAGRLVAQQDGEPCAGRCPTAAWTAGTVVVDEHEPIPLPQGIPPGEYRLLVGMYTWPAVERLPVSGYPTVAGDAAQVADLTVGRG